MSEKSLVMYSRSFGCPFITVAKRVLKDYALTYHELLIDRDPEAKQRVLDWTGFLSVPTLVVASNGDLLPYEAPAPLAKGESPRGIDRGSMITEPSMDQLEDWLKRHGFIEAGEPTG
ncbi:MAG: glutaredoxin [Chloroflexi bacterium]|nr:glutaredoxin [Chloroflexota bacterium]